LKSSLCDATSGRGSASRASKMEGVMFRIFFPIFTTDNIADTQNALGFFKHLCEQTSLPLQPECGLSRRCFPTQHPRTRLSQTFGALFLEHLSHSSAELEWHDAFDNNTDFLGFFCKFRFFYLHFDPPFWLTGKLSALTTQDTGSYQ
jgi:hypothetical protein